MRHIPSEVVLGTDEGMPRECAANLDCITTIPKDCLPERLVTLSPEKVKDIESAIHFALGLEQMSYCESGGAWAFPIWLMITCRDWPVSSISQVYLSFSLYCFDFLVKVKDYCWVDWDRHGGTGLARRSRIRQAVFRTYRRSELRGGGGKRATGGQGAIADTPRLWVGWNGESLAMNGVPFEFSLMYNPGKNMNDEFRALVDELPGLLERLLNSSLRPRRNLGNLPRRGIYVFFEEGRPIYVGRSNRMKGRIQEHGRPSSTHNSAPFAFNVGKKAAGKKGVDVSEKRAELEKDPTFAPLFSEAKERVSRMWVRVIEIDDPILQTLFEVYACIALRTTEYNDFDTH